MLLVVLCITQCKPISERNDNDSTHKTKLRCEITIDGGSKSDFTNLMINGKINWSDGRECIYLAVHGDDPQIIELESWSEGNQPTLEFIGEADDGLVVPGEEYDVWYFGHSQQLHTPYINRTKTRLEGSVAKQSGRIEDLGYCHIAKTKVRATMEGEEVRLNLSGTLVNQVAIALVDLENATELYGNAIIGTEYALEYGEQGFELNIIKDDDAKISVDGKNGMSYIVLLPNDNKVSNIKTKRNGNTYVYTFHNYVKANKVYYRIASDGTTIESLKWREIEEVDGHEYVDLGLPSGLLWAAYNVGASLPEEYGNYYAWGEIDTKDKYNSGNSLTYGNKMNDISGNPYMDAATANWGGSWRMPTKDEQTELRSRCTWTLITQNGVEGYNVEGPNGNSIFLPAAGYKNRGYGSYWSSTPYSDVSYAFNIYFPFNNHYFYDCNRYFGQSVRAVYGGNFNGANVQYAIVEISKITEITTNSAVCAGNVVTDNGSGVTERGICWTTSGAPTIEDNKIVADYSGVGGYSINMTELSPNTRYYVRAYVTNEAGTNYGGMVQFTTDAAVKYVDLGLSVKWATCNVGARIVEGYGTYYAWGEVEPAQDLNYDSKNCQTFGKVMSDISGNIQYDASTFNCGDEWRMPTLDELQELKDKCIWEWTTFNDVYGYKVIGPNGNSIFIPAAGHRVWSGQYNCREEVSLWCSTPCNDINNFFAYYLNYSEKNSFITYTNRYQGYSVRPVLK